MLYHAFQIVTDAGYILYAHPIHPKLKARLWAEIDILKRERETVESIDLGTVEAENVPSALDKVRAGEWKDYFGTRTSPRIST